MMKMQTHSAKRLQEVGGLDAYYGVDDVAYFHFHHRFKIRVRFSLSGLMMLAPFRLSIFFALRSLGTISMSFFNVAFSWHLILSN